MFDLELMPSIGANLEAETPQAFDQSPSVPGIRLVVVTDVKVYRCEAFRRPVVDHEVRFRQDPDQGETAVLKTDCLIGDDLEAARCDEPLDSADKLSGSWGSCGEPLGEQTGADEMMRGH
jgi:hypothetical protein